MRCCGRRQRSHTKIVPTLCVGMPLVTLRVTLWDAERPRLHSHVERGYDHQTCGQNARIPATP
ncbi:hypothetical protein B7453_21845 [Pseudomonas sp. IB20]|nr:hypothetical protein B7453_21845 [Pseudomonas sp. IB20]